MSINEDKAREFVTDRDAALRALTMEAYKAFVEKWQVKQPSEWASPTVPMATMHKARMVIMTFTPEEKTLSAQWLRENGYQLPMGMKLRGGRLYGATYAKGMIVEPAENEEGAP